MPINVTIHELKINPYAYNAVKNGDKTFEIRINDRVYQKCDQVIFQVWENNCYNTSYPVISAEISYVTNFQQKEGWCVFGLKNVMIGK